MLTTEHRGPAEHNAFSLLLAAALSATLTSGCVSIQKERSFKQSSVTTVSIENAVPCRDMIDRYTTYMVYFRLEKPVDALSVSVTAEYVADITGAKKSRKTYFIVEKIVDMSRFKNRNLKDLHAEIGRNYDADWNRGKELTLISNDTEPFKSLDADSTYRIRFTAFALENFEFTITVNADCAVTFANAP
ncbi:MAG: hypothetical protein JW807_02875 [Spirochaetes bacterium]|nr:hypothetical protein [Spirochaetota bacterium]